MGAKGFVRQLVQSLNISRDATHLGLILFAGEAKVLFKFGDEEFHSNEASINRINRISRKRFMPTRTDRALEAANSLLFVPEAGDRPANPNVLILLTDGKTHPTSKPFPQIVPLLKVSFHIECNDLWCNFFFRSTALDCCDKGRVMGILTFWGKNCLKSKQSTFVIHNAYRTPRGRFPASKI